MRDTREVQAIDLGDVQLHVETCGEGSPLFLLHGFGGCVRRWDRLSAEFARTRRVVTIDLRGHGRSTEGLDRFSHCQAGKDVLDVADRLGIERFSAVGVSSGGMALLHTAISAPSRVSDLVVVSATTRFTDQARRAMRRASFETMPSVARAIYEECASRGRGQISSLLSQFGALADDHEDVNFGTAELSRIRARTLVIHGDRDELFPVEIALDLFRSISDAALWVVPGGDHALIEDASLPMAETVLRFLRN